MKLRIKALRSLRWNYRWRGVWAWLRGTCGMCEGHGSIVHTEAFHPTVELCRRCKGKPKRGYQRILSEPQQVIAEQEATAEGVFV